MSNWALIYHNYAADATFTATNDSAYPEANLATTRTDKIYQRTATVTALTVDMDLGASSALIGSTDWGIVWGGTTLGDAATWSIITDDNSGFSSSTSLRASAAMFDVSQSNPLSWQQPWGRHGISLGTTAIERYVRFSFTESGGAVLDGSFVFAGPVWQPTKSYGLGWSRKDKTRPGGLSQRGFKARFENLTLAEAQEVGNILRYVGTERRVFVVPRTDQDDTWLADAMLCHWDGEEFMVEHEAMLKDGSSYYSLEVNFVEVTY